MEAKVEKLKVFFKNLPPEKKYEALMELGRKLKPLPEELRRPDKRVPGCQSILYLHSEARGGKIFFQASGDALISIGLAALLIQIYDGEDFETVIKSDISFLKDWGLEGALSLGRSNGLYQIHLRMKQDALKFLVA